MWSEEENMEALSIDNIPEKVLVYLFIVGYALTGLGTEMLCVYLGAKYNFYFLCFVGVGILVVWILLPPELEKRAGKRQKIGVNSSKSGGALEDEG